MQDERATSGRFNLERSHKSRPARAARASVLLLVLVVAAALSTIPGARGGDLESDWQHPPRDTRLRAYWWWLNGNVTKAAITRDLVEMQAKGFGGALICDAGGAEQSGNARVPHGPTFFTPEWRELYKHTLREANRLGLEMGLNIQSGWNLGGPMVTADDAPKKLVWTTLQVTGPKSFSGKLPQPAARDHYYRDLFVLAYRLKPDRTGNSPARRPLQNWEQKALIKPLQPFSDRPDLSPRRRWHVALGRAGGFLRNSSLRLHGQRPLPGLDAQRWLGGLCD